MAENLAERMGLDGAPDTVIERFKNAKREREDEDVDELLKNYREDVSNPDVDAEKQFREAVRSVSIDGGSPIRITLNKATPSETKD